MRMKKPVIILFLFMIFVLSQGQDINLIISEDSIQLINIREVVITANRSGSLLFYTPEAIKSLDSRSIKRFQLRSAPEALTLTPGLFVQKTNHGGGSPFIRGLTGNQTLLLIDGIRLSNATFRYGPNQYFNTIDIFSIAKLEILRGNGSVQYGSDALGGTIQAFTYDPLFSDKFNAGADIQTRLASHGMEQSLRAGFNFGNKNYAVKGGMTLRNFGDLVGGDTTGRQTPSGYKERDYDLKARFLLSESTTATVAYQDVHQDDIPVYHKIVLEDYAINEMDPQKRKLAYLRINHEFDRKILESMIVTASYQFTKENRESRKSGADIIRYESDRVQSAGFSVQARFSKGGKWTATNGIEIYNDIVRSSRSDHDLVNSVIISKRGLYPDGASMTSLAAFTIHEINLSKWSFTAGTRFNTFIIKADDETTGITRLTPTAIVGNLAMMRKLNSRSNIFSSVTSGFRAPNIDDLGSLGIVDFRYEVPNYDLRPEQSVQYQAGFKYFD
ncbi:MAG: TonB-dependent receptor, partial [Bacteroidales bacterium]|nr:TonB-dependent receptor [Bacteroidales bacterium]